MTTDTAELLIRTKPPLRPLCDSRPRPKHKAPRAWLVRSNALLLGLIGGGAIGVVVQMAVAQ